MGLSKFYIFSLLSLFFYSVEIIAQDLQLDSLKSIINENKKDTINVNALLDISNILSKSDTLESKNYALKAIDLAEELDYKKGQAYGYKNLGLLLYAKGELNKELIDYWEKSLELFKKIDFKNGISNLQGNLGSVYQTKGDDPTALAYFLNSLRLAEEINEPKRIGTAYINIGSVYANEKATYEQAIESFNKAKKICENIDYKEGIAYAAVNIAELYLKTNNPKAALQVLNEYMTFFDKADADKANGLIMIGRAYEDMGEPNIAEKKYMEAITLATENDAKMEASKAYIQLGNMYNKKNELSKSLDKYEKALELTEITNVLPDKKKIYEGLANIYAKLGNYENAFDFQKQFSAVMDTIRSDDYEHTLGNLRFQYDIENKEKEIQLLNTENKVKEIQLEKVAISKKYFYAVSVLLFAIAFGALLQYRFVKKSNRRLADEQNKTESILLNILPAETAEELKLHGSVKAREFKQITVLFTDFKAFSTVAELIPADKLVKSVDYYFKKFDEIVEKYGLEKIKTIGDAYMCAGGLPTENETNAMDAYNAAIEILQFVNNTQKNPPKNVHPFEIRIGLNSGSVVAGVVGTKKFQYDIWGNTVNIAARMESSSIPGKINVSENTYNLLKDKIDFTYRGIITVKNSKKLKMYFVGKEMNENEIIS
ncbi:adenylate/guanylate cyclase domain-containing protein [uncultured Maribacter sp.]|uniref:adenylate/guanylate cyclase domain-containing protein n=1 Tax=uncultured Maribacter sp. TaxID=431308 RepID=UPI0030DBA07D